MATDQNQIPVATVPPIAAPNVSLPAPPSSADVYSANNISQAITNPAPAVPLLASVNPSGTYAPVNVSQISLPSNKEAEKMKLSKLEKQYANANTLAETNQNEILRGAGSTKAMGVLTGEARYQSGVDTARLNAFNMLYQNRLAEEKRKEAKKQAFISQYGADPTKRPKGMSEREFAKALGAGQFSNLLTQDYKLKQAQIKKTLSDANPGSGTTEQDKLLKTIASYNSAGVDVPQSLLDRLSVLNGSDKTTKNTTTPLNQLTPQEQDAMRIAAEKGGNNWGAIVQNLKEQGISDQQLSTGGAFDLALNQKFNPANYQNMVSATIPKDYQPILQGKTQEQTNAFMSFTPNEQSNVSQLLNGDVLLSDLVASRGVQGSRMKQDLLEKARMIDPNFSENENKQRFTFKQQWNNPQGKQFITRTAINTAMGHLAEVNDAFQELSKVDAGVLTLKGNELKNWLAKNKANGAVQAFELARDNFASEIATVYKGGVPDQLEVQARREQLDGALSAKGLIGVADMAAAMLGSKINATANEYKAVMGRNPDQPLISPQALESLYNSGIDTSPIAKDLQAQGYQIDPKYLKPPTPPTSNPDEWLKSTTAKGGLVSKGTEDYLTKLGY